ncbi:MAG: hypothetical protein WKG00_37910 [Polyangiaceae bacterium]
MTKTRRFGVAVVLSGLAMLGTGCSKNDTASSACASMASSDTCSACCTQNGANGYKHATGSACECMGGNAKAAAPGAGTTPSASFAGSYKSAWGQTVFNQTGNQVSATYPNGTIACVATGNVADCDWKEAKGVGKAKLVKEAGGAIKGTWGMGASATDGGAWNFTP